MGGSAVEDGSVLKLERRVNTSVAVAESGLVSLPQRTQGHTFGALRRNEPRVAVLRETLEGTAVGPGLAQETRMKTILLVDDHNLFRQVLAVVLKHRTVFKENIQAGSLAEARQILADRDVRFDLAIVDLDHSEGGATELIDKLYEFDVPVLALTVGQSLGGRTRALQAGAAEVFNLASDEEIVGVVNGLISE